MNGQSAWGLQQFRMADSIRRREQERKMAEAMQQQGIGMVSNVPQALGAILKGWLTSGQQARKDEALSGQLEQFFQADEQRRQQEAQAAEAERQRLRQEALDDFRTKEGIKAEANPKDARTSAQKNAEAMGLKPGTPEFNAFIRQAGGPASTNVTIQQPGQNYEKPFDTALAKADVARFDAMRSGAEGALRENATLAQLEGQLGQTYTGFGAEQLLGLKQAALAFGVGDPEEIGAAEAARALSNKLALQMRNPAGGEGMPGAMSDKDREFLVSSIAGLRNTPDGWKKMIAMRQQVNNYTIAQAREAEQYLRSGGDRMGLVGHLQQWADANPLFAGQQQAPQQSAPQGWSIRPLD